ncbi:hypothetical protein SLS63_007459 [Diaporthe eres]|uniref:BTB domain-containing protein n=1 Tax=Diaporthe eres TaxID=83184 RepID=A0ABR1P590_DIAER
MTASEITGISAGDISSHSISPGCVMSIQIQMEPDVNKPDLTSCEVTKPERRYNSFSGPPMPTIFVGPGKVKFLVHQLIFCRFSAFLRDAFATATDTDSITRRPRLASFFDLVKLHVFAQTYGIQAVQESIISTINARLFDDREIWATLGSETDLLEYLVCLVGTGARLYTLITHALACRMFPAATSQQKVSVPFTDGNRIVPLPGRASDIFPRMPQLSRLHGLAKNQANRRQILDAYGKGDSEEVDMSKILDAVPAALLRDILKEYFRMKSRARLAWTGFEACVGTDFDFHLPHPAL